MDQVQPVQPAGSKSGLFAVELTCIRYKGTGAWAVHDQLSERAKNKESQRATDGVADDNSGTSLGKAAAGTHEQSGTNGTADSDHVDLTGA